MDKKFITIDGVQHATYCSRCGSGKPEIKYNKSSDGKKQYYFCNVCNTERAKRYRKTEKGKERVYTAVYKSIKNNKIQTNARAMLRDHISRGLIIRPEICSNCAKKGRIQGYHHDFLKPLEVRWLCTRCYSQSDLSRKASSPQA